MSSSFHAAATVSQWLAGVVNGVAWPGWATAPSVVFDAPDMPVALPCFSIEHRPPQVDSAWMGAQIGAGTRGTRASGSALIGAWAGSADPDRAARLRQMAAVVETAFTLTSALTLLDFTLPSAPVAMPYRVLLTGLQPDRTRQQLSAEAAMVWRWRLVYRWIVRG